ncbi:MAG: class I SAM-dependent methyltransferase, partial [Ilumatobacteraceae bacterium]
MARRSLSMPWKTAGRVTEQYATGDEVVRETGWVFNNATGNTLTLAEFVASGDDEVPTYLRLFELEGDRPDLATCLEIGSGIGRMTCAFTRTFGTVVAADLDAGFLERCRETVARFGKIDRLRTLEVPDGQTLDLSDDAADVAFSYITLQHCSDDDALGLIDESIRVVRPGGRVALNLRSRSSADLVARPLGAVVRGLFGVPGLGDWLSRRRAATRLAWQANRIAPDAVVARAAPRLDDVAIWRHPAGTASAP